MEQELHLPCGSRGARRRRPWRQDGPRWYCFQVRKGEEARAFEALWQQGFEPYIPVTPTERRHARKVELVLAPLFPGYGFVRFDIRAQPWRKIWSTRGVIRLFSTAPERPVPIPDWIVQRVRQDERSARSGGFDIREVFEAVDPGTALRIREGKWRNAEGICLVDEGTRVEMLLGMIRMTVPKGMLEKVRSDGKG